MNRIMSLIVTQLDRNQDGAPSHCHVPPTAQLLVLHTWPEPKATLESNLRTDVSSVLMHIYERLHSSLTCGTLKAVNNRELKES